MSPAAEAAQARRQAHGLMHACVVLWGFTAILGKLITLSAVVLVAWRLLLVLAVLAVLVLLPRTWRGWRAMAPALRARAALAGVFVALHWWTFYGAIKLANASVAAACIAAAPVFLAIVEPLLTRRPFQRRELWLATLAIPGVWLVAGGTPPQMGLGIAVGLLSAFLVAIFGALNKTLAREADPYTLTAVEFVAGLGVLGLGIALTSPAVLLPGPTDLGWLLLLALGCTLAPFVMAFVALRTLTAWAAQLVVNLEPVYAVALAALLLGEGAQLTWPFYLGLALLIAVTASAARAPR